jgi:hypothetical protein
MVVSQSTISDSACAAIANFGTARVQRTAMSHNECGVYNGSGTVAIAQSTVADDSVGILNDDVEPDHGPPSVVTLKSTILDDGNPDCQGIPVISRGHNLADDRTCKLTAQGDQPNTDPLLRPLDSYGGPTKTFALRAASPAVDAGSAGSTTVDQRGLPRIVNHPGVPKAVAGDNSDIGAFELQSP